MQYTVMMMFTYLVVCLAGCPESTPEPDASQVGEMDLSQDGTYVHGAWQYVFTITAPGTRSQGTLGQLSYAGQAVPLPKRSADYYETPWGRFVFVGMPPGTEDHPVMPWHDKGWMPVTSDAAESTGQALPCPGTPDAVLRDAGKQMRDIVLEWASSHTPEQAVLAQTENGDDSIDIQDPWGTAFKVYPDLRGGEGGGDVLRWVIVSAGPDRQFSTEDDLERHSSFVKQGQGRGDDADLGMREGPTTPEPEAE